MHVPRPPPPAAPRRAGAIAVLASVTLALSAATSAPATAGKGPKGPKGATIAWAPAATAAITPGVQTYTDGGQCTANFVFTDGSGKVYIGHAAHCAGTGGATETDGCTPVLAAGHPGHLRPGGSLVSDGRRSARHPGLLLVADHAGPQRD